MIGCQLIPPSCSQGGAISFQPPALETEPTPVPPPELLGDLDAPTTEEFLHLMDGSEGGVSPGTVPLETTLPIELMLEPNEIVAPSRINILESYSSVIAVEGTESSPSSEAHTAPERSRDPTENESTQVESFTPVAISLEFYLINGQLYAGSLAEDDLLRLQMLKDVAEPEDLERFITEHGLQIPPHLDPTHPAMTAEFRAKLEEIVEALSREGRHEEKEEREDGVLVTVHTLEPDGVRVTMESFPLIALPLTESDADDVLATSGDDLIAPEVNLGLSAPDAPETAPVAAQFYATDELASLMQLFVTAEPPTSPDDEAITPASPQIVAIAKEPAPSSPNLEVLDEAPSPTPVRTDDSPVPHAAATPSEPLLPHPISELSITEPVSALSREITPTLSHLPKLPPGPAPAELVAPPSVVNEPPVLIVSLDSAPFVAPTPPQSLRMEVPPAAGQPLPPSLEPTIPSLPVASEPVARARQPLPPDEPPEFHPELSEHRATRSIQAVSSAATESSVTARVAVAEAQATHLTEEVRTTARVRATTLRVETQAALEVVRQERSATPAVAQRAAITAKVVDREHVRRRATRTIEERERGQSAKSRQTTVGQQNTQTTVRDSRTVTHERKRIVRKSVQYARHAAAFPQGVHETTQTILHDVIDRWATSQEQINHVVPPRPPVIGDAPIARRQIQPVKLIVHDVISRGLHVEFHIEPEALVIEPADTDPIRRAKTATTLTTLAKGRQANPLTVSLS